jgi:hypothetical protein
MRLGLDKKGHKLGCLSFAGLVAQGIEIAKNGDILAYSDGRKGETDGF